MIDKILAKIFQENFLNFLSKSFETLNFGKIFHYNWHISSIIELLKSVEKYKKPNKLIINIPPRHLKSTIISISWPAWLLANDPTIKIIAASYAEKLSLKLSQDTRIIIESPWYKRTFPHTIIASGENEKYKFSTTKRGFRLAASVGGSLIGEGGDILIVDDPLTPLQANSVHYINRVNNWFSNTFITRLNDQNTGVIIIIMQRLDSNDLTGYLEQFPEWEKFSLPIIADKTRQISINNFAKTYKKGEILAPNLFNMQQIESLQRTLGNRVFSAQYLQNPLPISSALINIDDINKFDLSNYPKGAIIQSWDTSSSNNAASDYSVCLTWNYINGAHYLIDMFRKKLIYPQLKKAVVNLFKQYAPDIILMENKASGLALIQELNTQLPIKNINPSKDKLTRFLGITNHFEQGNIFAPKNVAWLLDFEQELVSFPNSKHDDIVDALSQYLNWHHNTQMILPSIRRV